MLVRRTDLSFTHLSNVCCRNVRTPVLITVQFEMAKCVRVLRYLPPEATVLHLCVPQGEGGGGYLTIFERKITVK